MRAFTHEARQARSQLRRHPGFTCVLAGILGRGLAVTLHRFTVAKARMPTPRSYAGAARIMMFPARAAARVDAAVALRAE